LSSKEISADFVSAALRTTFGLARIGLRILKRLAFIGALFMFTLFVNCMYCLLAASIK
jgi:hypothetical protein